MCSAIAFRIGLIGSRRPSPGTARARGRVGNVRRLGVERPRRLLSRLEVREQVLLANPPADAVSLDLREIHVVLVRHAADDGGDEPGAIALAWGMGPVLRDSRAVLRRSGRSGSAAAAGVDLGDRLADGHGVARLREDAGQDALGRARDLDVDLVGRDVADRLVGLDRIADGLPPLEDRPLGDGDAHLGHRDGDRLRISS